MWWRSVNVMEINSPLVWTVLPCFHSRTLVYFLRVTFHCSCIFPLPLFWCHSGIVTISITYEQLLCFAAVLSSAIVFNQLLALSYYFLLFLEFLNFTKLSIYFQFLHSSSSLGTLTNVLREWDKRMEKKMTVNPMLGWCWRGCRLYLNDPSDFLPLGEWRVNAWVTIPQSWIRTVKITHNLNSGLDYQCTAW